MSVIRINMEINLIFFGGTLFVYVWSYLFLCANYGVPTGPEKSQNWTVVLKKCWIWLVPS